MLANPLQIIKVKYEEEVDHPSSPLVSIVRLLVLQKIEQRNYRIGSQYYDNSKGYCIAIGLQGPERIFFIAEPDILHLEDSNVDELLTSEVETVRSIGKLLAANTENCSGKQIVNKAMQEDKVLRETIATAGKSLTSPIRARTTLAS